MIRPVLTELALFLAPFAAYALFLWATRAGVLAAKSWRLPTLGWLAAVAFGVMIGRFVPTALPDEVTRRAAAAGFRAVPTGVEHGTVTVVVEGQGFEVTTLREDVETFGRKAKVRFGRSWQKDAARRDFTLNALSVSRDGTVH